MRTLTGGEGEQPPEGVDPKMWETGKAIYFVPVSDRSLAQCWICGTLKVMFGTVYICPWCDCFHEGDNHRTCECHRR